VEAEGGGGQRHRRRLDARAREERGSRCLSCCGVIPAIPTSLDCSRSHDQLTIPQETPVYREKLFLRGKGPQHKGTGKCHSGMKQKGPDFGGGVAERSHTHPRVRARNRALWPTEETLKWLESAWPRGRERGEGSRASGGEKWAQGRRLGIGGIPDSTLASVNSVH